MSAAATAAAAAAATTTTVAVYTDGSAMPNPGHAAYGVVVLVDGTSVSGDGVYLGDSTSNNVAEWRGVVEGLRRARAYPSATLYTDSQLAVRQLSGEYRVRKPELVPLHSEAVELMRDRDIRVCHVLRARNALADSLAGEAARRRANVRLRTEITAVDGPKRARTADE